MKESFGGNRFVGLAVLCAGLFVGQASSAQTAGDNDSQDASGSLEEIVVTGSRIRRAETAQPTIDISGASIDDRGFTNVADALNQIPQFSPGLNTFGTTGTTSSGTSGGVQFVNFFGLGTQRTLTLLNGRRVVSGNSLDNSASAGVQVDLSIIPTGLIERIDVVSVGGAPIYGSDAVAGVVNVILKDDYQGFEINGQYGVTAEGDGDEYRLRALWGGNFGNDRGNAVLSVEYAQTDPLDQFDRPGIFLSPGFQSNTSGIALPDGTVPNEILVRDQRVHVVTEGGIPLLGDFILDNAESAGVPIPGVAAASQFARNGDLVPYDPGMTNEVVFGDGGDGLLLPSWVDLRQETERVILVGQSNYDLTPNVEVFAEALFANNDAVDPRNSPFINSNLFPGGGRDVLGIRLTNPYLTAQARGVLTAALDSTGDGVADLPVIDTDGDGVPDTPGFFLSQFTDQYQNGAPSFNQSTTYRGVLGLRGDFEMFDRNFFYDVSYNYGRTDSNFRESDRYTARFINAVNAVALTDTDIAKGIPAGVTVDRGGDLITIGAGAAAQAGDIICAGYLTLFADPGVPVDLSTPNPALDGCVPLNPFGLGGVTQGALDFFLIDQTSQSRLEQQVVSLNLSGKILELPAGPLEFAVGYESREESGRYSPGEFLILGLGDAPPETGIRGEFSTDEFLLEISAPILDPSFATVGPFGFMLDLEAAARRVSNSTTDTETTYTVGGRFSFHPDLTFRGNFTRSIRAPAITELFLPVQRTDSFATDPCDIDNIVTGPNPTVRRTNCIAAVIASGNASNETEAAAFLSTFESIIDNALQPITTGGNPNLDNEIAESYTFGFSYRPSFIEGLILSMDYVDIGIEDAIFNVDGTSLLSACFDSAAYPVAVCDSVFRDGNFQINNLITGFANIGFIDFSSVSGQIGYTRDVGGIPLISPSRDGTFDLSVSAQYIDSLNISVLGTGDDLNREANEPGNPRLSLLANLGYLTGPLYVFLQTEYQGETDINRDDRDFQTLERPFIGAFTRFNLGGNYRISDTLHVRLVVDNLFDEKPEIQAVASGDAALFDPLGRNFRVGFTAEF